MLILALLIVGAACACFLQSKRMKNPKRLQLICAALLLLGFLCGVLANRSPEESAVAAQIRKLENASLLIPVQKWSQGLGASGTLIVITGAKKEGEISESDLAAIKALKTALPNYEWRLMHPGASILTPEDLAITLDQAKGIVCLASLPRDPEALRRLFEESLAPRPPILILKSCPAGIQEQLGTFGQGLSWLKARAQQPLLEEQSTDQELFDLNFELVQKEAKPDDAEPANEDGEDAT
ncbi:MAG: hypothetical protein RL095_767 [Verrucomicrobiota bacterium]|jgi:hypothetical protein